MLSFFYVIQVKHLYRRIWWYCTFFFVKCLDQSTIGIDKNASHTQLIIESQLLVNFNSQKNNNHTLSLELSLLISLVNIRLSSLVLMYIKNICTVCVSWKFVINYKVCDWFSLYSINELIYNLCLMFFLSRSSFSVMLVFTQNYYINK